MTCKFCYSDELSESVKAELVFLSKEFLKRRSIVSFPNDYGDAVENSLRKILMIMRVDR